MTLNKQLAHLNLTGGIQTKDDERLVIPSKLSRADDVEFDDASSIKRRGGVVRRAGAAGDAAYRAFTHRNRSLMECEDGNYLQTSTGLRKLKGTRKGSYSSAPVDVDNVPRVSAALTPVGGVNRRTDAPTTFIKASFDSCMNNDNTRQLTVWEQQSADGSHTLEWLLTDEKGQEVSRGVFNGPDPTHISVFTSPRVMPQFKGGFYVLYAAYNYFSGPPASFQIRYTEIGADGLVTAGTSLYASAATGLIESTYLNTCMFDISTYNQGTNFGMVVRDTNGPGTLSFYLFDSVFSILGANTATPSALPSNLTSFITNVGGTLRVHAFYSIQNSTVKGRFLASGSVSSEVTLATSPIAGAVGGIVQRTAATYGGVAATGTSSSDILIAYEVRYGSTSCNVHYSKFSATHTSILECQGATQGWLLGGGIIQQQNRNFLLFQNAPGAAQVTFSLAGTAPTTSFVADLSILNGNWGAVSLPPVVIARAAIGETALPDGGSVNNLPRRLPQGSSRNSSGDLSMLWPILRFNRDLVIVNGGNESTLSLAMLQLSDRGSGQLGYAEVNGLTYLAGACPQIFDGVQFVEEGFHHGPYVRTAALATNVSPALTYESKRYGPFAAGTASFVFTETWTDAQGNFHESAPSAQVTLTFTVGQAYGLFELQRPPTRKPGSRLRAYRTKISSPDTALYLFVTEDNTAVLTDVTIAASEQLYTAGGVIPNTPMPSCRHISVFQNRLVAVGGEDPYKLYWSKINDEGYGVEFNVDDSSFQTIVPIGKGRVVAALEMDDRLIILCEGGHGSIYGQGPSDTGTQGSYSAFTSLVTETGALWAAPRSVIRSPEGIWFQSPSGMRLLSRAGGLARSQDGKELGSDVDTLVNAPVVSVGGGTTNTQSSSFSFKLSSRQQIRFYLTNSSYALVWDYQWQQWSRFSNQYAVDAVFADGLFNVLSPSLNSFLYTDDAGAVQADTSSTSGATYQAFTGSIKTSWLSFAGLQGFQRVYRLNIVGRMVPQANGAPVYSVPANVSVSVAYDYRPSNSLDAFTAALSDNTDGLIQLQHHFVQQKCESMQLAINFYPDPNVSGVGFRLTDLTLQVGLKYGSVKLPSSQRF